MVVPARGSHREEHLMKGFVGNIEERMEANRDFRRVI
jgi:hypothetical protein